jgi:hypothetical protein
MLLVLKLPGTPEKSLRSVELNTPRSSRRVSHFAA